MVNENKSDQTCYSIKHDKVDLHTAHETADGREVYEESFRVNKTYNLFAIVVYDTKNKV